MNIGARVTVKGQRQVDRAVSVPDNALRVAGRALRNLAVDWFRQKNSDEPNQIGGKRTNFWTDIGRSVNQPVSINPGAVEIAVSDPRFSQKYLGGPIEAKRSNWLTIPANTLTHGKPASAFNLLFVFIRKNLAMLIRKDDMKKAKRFKTQRRSGNGVETFEQNINQEKGTVMYWLKKRVFQNPWPGCFPDQRTMEDTAREAYSGYLKMIFLRGGAN